VIAKKGARRELSLFAFGHQGTVERGSSNVGKPADTGHSPRGASPIMRRSLSALEIDLWQVVHRKGGALAHCCIGGNILALEARRLKLSSRSRH
jgi:hypothetical protein